jgi:hypothetical protein
MLPWVVLWSPACMNGRLQKYWHAWHRILQKWTTFAFIVCECGPSWRSCILRNFSWMDMIVHSSAHTVIRRWHQLHNLQTKVLYAYTLKGGIAMQQPFLFPFCSDTCSYSKVERLPW